MKTIAAEKIRDELIDLLRKQYQIPVVYQLSHGQRVYRVGNHNLHLYVKVSNLQKGFWGAREKIVTDLNEISDWVLILLLGRADAHIADGWLIGRQSWATLSGTLSWSEKDEEYKINRHNLDDDRKISGIKSIAEAVISYGKLQSSASVPVS